MTFEIVTFDFKQEAWVDDTVGDENTFTSADDAIEAIYSLKDLGDEWADTEYAVRAPDGTIIRTPYDMFVETALEAITCEREEDAQMWADRLEAVSEFMSDKMIAKAQIEVGKQIGRL